VELIPFQEYGNTPDPKRPPFERLHETIMTVLEKAQPAHMPGSRIGGCGGYLFVPRPDHMTERDMDIIESYPKKFSQPLLDALDEKLFKIWPFIYAHMAWLTDWC
jgi:hypothetical protein